ncbi:MAG TPA: MBL fold metallo-hydrolase [Opitutaceae bacterium]|nr:MBL fold metallo-hydrolase [Opitutaceae bacterium]HND61430.1 MBL fold metallo-hydrolase [Opitutaceae bacterium]
MNLHVLPAGPIQTNAYLLTDPGRGEAVLVDAPGGIWAEVAPILERERCRLTELWLTHGHWDHTQGAAEVVRRAHSRVRAHADDRVLYETPEVMSAFLMPGLTLEPVHPDAWVTAGATFQVLGTTIEVRHVPGHCPGNVLFYLPAAKAAFVGDALFAGSVGRTDFPGGSMEMLEKSIRGQIYTLPDETIVYPGHGPDTTVGVEKESNPYVSG